MRSRSVMELVKSFCADGPATGPSCPCWQAGLAQDLLGGNVLASRGTVSALAALLQHKLQEQRSPITERPGDRECEPPLSRRARGSGGGIRARIGHRAWDSSASPQVTRLAPNRLKIVRVFEFIPLTSAPGRIRTCAHGSGLRLGPGDGIGRELRWLHPRHVHRNPGSGDHQRRHARRSAPRQPGPAAPRRHYLRPWPRRTGRDAVGTSGGSGLTAPARGAPRAARAGRGAPAHLGAHAHPGARTRLLAQRDRRGACLGRLIRQTPDAGWHRCPRGASQCMSRAADRRRPAAGPHREPAQCLRGHPQTVTGAFRHAGDTNIAHARRWHARDDQRIPHSVRNA